METTPALPRRIRITTVVPAGWIVAAAGTATRRAYGWRIAAAPRPLSRAAAWVFVLQGRCPDLHSSLFTFLPFAAASSAGAWACAPGAQEDAAYIGGSMAFRIITVPFDNDRGVFPDNGLNNFLPA